VIQEAQHSAQMQMQQYVIDIQALERNNDAVARELQTAKTEAEDLARDRNRVLEQMQAAQVWQVTTLCKLPQTECASDSSFAQPTLLGCASVTVCCCVGYSLRVRAQQRCLAA
jgi:FtsZ-binding cell division protein ZapB